MSAEELGVLFAGISAILATLIYFTKNIKQSSCCGNDCKQTVLDGHGDPVRSTVDCFDTAMNTFPPAQIPAVPPVPAPRPPRHAHPLQSII
jgi:hypothetical protein